MSIWIYTLTQITVVAYAFIGGVFLAFSDFIMRSLAHTSGTGGVETMQIINREVFRWVFMALFLGLVPVSLFVAVFGLLYLDGYARALMSTAGLVYLVGCFGSTIAFNVPMNESLAKMDTTNASMEHYAGRSSMRSGSRQQGRPRSSSTDGSNSTITRDRTRHSICARRCPRLYKEMAQPMGARQ